MEEDNFPRGGSNKKQTRKRHLKSSDDSTDLFRGSAPQGDAKKSKLTVRESKALRLKKQVDTREKLAIAQSFDPSSVHIDILRKKQIEEGMLILGVVREVHDYNILVSLSNGVVGAIPISAVCKAYTDLLQTLAKAVETNTAPPEDVAGLSELFHEGMVVRCRVTAKAVPKTSQEKGTPVQLSVNPAEVNRSVVAKDLTKGMILTGCVSSVEDHGYLVDIGVSGVRAFLSQKAAKTYIADCRDGRPLYVGNYLHCLVTSDVNKASTGGDVRSVAVTVDPAQLKAAAATPASDVTMQKLLPGTVVEGSVLRVREPGIVVSFLAYKGSVNSVHLKKACDQYKEGDKVLAAVLYIYPTSKLVSLTCLGHLVTPDPRLKVAFEGLAIGSIVEKAEVKAIQKLRGVFFQLQPGVKGLAETLNLSDKPVKNVVEAFPVGSKHKCRVVSLERVDNLVILSLKRSILDQQFLNVEEIIPGMKIQVTIVNLETKGAFVSVTKRIKGLISREHLANVPLKHPEKKYKVGDKVKCKVLKVNKEKRWLTLTAKPLLLKQKTPITDLSQCTPGSQVSGWIAKVYDNGVLLAFFNGVQGFVPKNQLSSVPVEFPEKLFYEGQVMKARVLHCNPEEQRLTLSFRLEHMDPMSRKEVTLPEDFALGKMTDCKVLKKVEKGLEVALLPSGLKAFIPKMHLSDHVNMTDVLMNMYEPGSLIRRAMYISQAGFISLTKKRSLLVAASENAFITDYNDIKVGMTLPGVVNKKMEYGLFICISHGLNGLVPNKYLSDGRPEDPASLYHVGQSVVAKVLEKHDDKQRFLLSMRAKDCVHSDTEQGLDLLENYLLEYNSALEKCRQKSDVEGAMLAASRSIGDIVEVTITHRTKHGVLGRLDDSVQGLITTDNMPGVVCEVGDRHQAVVLYIDVTAGCLELSLDKTLIAELTQLSDTKFSKAKKGQVIKGEVHLVKHDMVLVALKGHAKGRLAFLPGKLHLNDVFGYRQFMIGQINPVVIKRTEDDRILASLKIHEDAIRTAKVRTEVSAKPGKKSSLKPGEIASAKVMKVLDIQLNIVANGHHGRVHVTELADNPAEGENVLSAFSGGENITIKVLSFREPTGASSSNQKRRGDQPRLLDCTVIPSKLLKEGLTAEDTGRKTYAPGDKVKCFISRISDQSLMVQLSPSVRGRIDLFHISRDFKVLKKLSKSFKVGQAYTATVVAQTDSNVDLALVDSAPPLAGDTVGALVMAVEEHKALRVALPGGFKGRVRITDVADKYTEDPLSGFRPKQILKCYVIDVDPDIKECVCSLRRSRLRTRAKTNVKDIEINSADDLQEGQILRGFVCNANQKGVIVRLGRDVIGRVLPAKVPTALASFAFPPGDLVYVAVNSVDPEKGGVMLSMMPEDLGDKCASRQVAAKGKQGKRRARENGVNGETGVDGEPGSVPRAKKTRVSMAAAAALEEDSGVEVKGSDSDVEMKEVADAPRLSLSAGFSWDEHFTLPETSGGEDLSDSDESDVEQQTTKTKHKSKYEKMREQKAEEQKLFETERELLDSGRLPQTAEDFDRLALQSPSSSLIWLRYMAFHLETAEVDKAKAVAERALKTISFREEQEKLNVWVAYMNLENMYGTPESLTHVFERALQQNDQLQVYNQLISIYVTSDKTEAAEQLHMTLVKKNSLMREAWVRFGQFYFSQDKPDSARKLMQRSLKSLERKDHVEVIAKFAQLEFKFGEPERGKTMFENILSNYPKRSDLWSIYIDMVTRIGDLDPVRSLYERVISLNLSAKKMKFFFKKFLDFEEKYGSEQTVQAVKQKAIEYVETKAELPTS